MKKLFFILFAIAGMITVNAQQNPQSDSLKEYTGKYKFPEGSAVPEVNITIENGMLFAGSSAGSSELKRIEKDLFEIVAYAGKATFRRNEEGKLVGVKIEVEDLIMEGTKEINSFQLSTPARSTGNADQELK
jgi:Domain of unknown function (DUF3471)